MKIHGPDVLDLQKQEREKIDSYKEKRVKIYKRSRIGRVELLHTM